MKHFLTLFLGLFFSQALLHAQAVSINTDGSAPAASAILDVKSTDRGMLVPRMTTAQRTAIAAANALLVYDTDTRSFWFFDSAAAAWREIRAGNFATLQDADGNTKVQVEKNPNEDVIRFDLGGTEHLVLRKNASGTARLEFAASNSIFIGMNSGSANTTGFGNTALGTNTLPANTAGFANTAAGNLALLSNTTGNFNSGFGNEALKFNTTGNNNTATGLDALVSNTTGSNNTAAGYAALAGNKANSRSTAIGYAAMFYADNRTSGQETFNTALGYEALRGSTTAADNTGQYNTAVGDHALLSNTSGVSNTASGVNALASNTTGVSNTTSGVNALRFNTTGSYNTASGVVALASNTTGNNNTAAGFKALNGNITGNNNTAVGYSADVAADNLNNATAIGYNAKVGASNSLVLGGTGADAVNVGIGTTTPVTAKLVISTIPGANGIDLSSADAYAEMRVIRNTLNASDQDLYLGFGSPAGSAVHVYSDGIETITAKGQRVGVGRLPITNHLEVEGDASKSTAGDWLANSDARLKKHIQPLNSQEMLQKMLALQGITYEWNDGKTGSARPEGIQYGFTAQNIQQVFPTLVEADKLGYLQTAYGTYDAMTVEAIRALHDKIEALQQENESLHARMAELESAKAENRAMKAQLDKITAALQTAGIGVEQR